MASVSPHLLADPAKLPMPRKATDGGQQGSQCLWSQQELYDVAGGIRATLIELQREVRLLRGDGDVPVR